MTRGQALVAVLVGALVIAGAILVPPLFAGDDAPPAVTLRGIVGSESGDFFTDPEVVAGLERRGIALAPVQKRGSWEIPASRDLADYDFALPSSSPAADRLRADRGVTEADSPFFSPLVIATYQPVVDTLTRAGVVRPGADGTPVLDVAALTDLVARGTRWSDLPGNTVPAPSRAVLLSTTDPADSNSAAMFVSIASYVLNGDRVVTTAAEIEQVVPRICPMIAAQGYKERSSQYLFDRYLTGGIGSTTMALVYENQWRAAQRSNTLQPGQVLLQASPTVYSRYTAVPLTEPGRALGRALTDDPDLVRRAAEYGFRPSRATAEPAAAGPLPTDVVDTPTYGVLSQLLEAVGTRCG